MGKDESCVETAGGPIVEGSDHEDRGAEAPPQRKEATIMTARVGKKAPDFQATAFQDGAFHNFKLSDYGDKWVVLCFYPGDFTFV